MLVVSDSTPLNILVRIHCADVLPALFERVIIPPAVERELSHPNTPEVVRAWIAAHPRWLETRVPSSIDAMIARDRGKCEAICPALELHVDLLLADDKDARRAAQRVGLTVTGTLGILEAAAARRFIDLPAALTRLRETDFFVADDLIRNVLDRAASHATIPRWTRTTANRQPEARGRLCAARPASALSFDPDNTVECGWS